MATACPLIRIRSIRASGDRGAERARRGAFVGKAGERQVAERNRAKHESGALGVGLATVHRTRDQAGDVARDEFGVDLVHKTEAAVGAESEEPGV